LLLISDLHLEPARADITRTLIHFLHTRASGHDQLFILGDLFEVWLGDDDVNPLAEQVAGELSRVSDAGTQIFLMHGNRDFLIGEDFARRCGAELLTEPHVMNVAGQPTALMHGDALCTRDTDYLEFRALVRQPSWQRNFLVQSLETRRAFAQQAREQSATATQAKTAEIMDVTLSEVDKLMQELQVTTLIHGHTHRPAVHTLEKTPLASQTRQRLVLGDWDRQGWCIALESEGLALQNFPLLQ
jgi:UDP-2,3-diacylglucosamine hydrolase